MLAIMLYIFGNLVGLNKENRLINFGEHVAGRYPAPHKHPCRRGEVLSPMLLLRPRLRVMPLVGRVMLVRLPSLHDAGVIWGRFTVAAARPP